MLKPKLCTVLKNYTKEQFIKDSIAGIIVAIIALPLSIALAIASGVPPEKGIHTAIIAGFLISLLGGSRVQIGGPTGAFVIIVSGIIHQYGLEGLIVATVMAGIIMIFFGFFKLGSFIKFVPYPITTGFTSGIAVIIFSTQVKDFLGLAISELPDAFIWKWHSLFRHIATINYAALLIGMLSLIIIIVWPKINKKIPGSLIAIIVATLLVRFSNLPVETVGSKFGAISAAFPALSFPRVSVENLIQLLSPALIIAVLASIESLLSAVVADGMIGGRHRPNMEIIAQGVANIGSGLCGGIPATGAIARTAANIKNGGRTPVAGMVHALVLLCILLVLMPLAAYIPLASLAAILIVVAYNMSEWRAFKELLKAPKSDIAVLLVTFSLTVLVDLVKAIEIGMIMAAFLFMKRMADVSHMQSILQETEDFPDPDEFSAFNTRRFLPGIEVYEINGPFFFGAADKFFAIIQDIEKPIKVLVLRMRHVPAIDATGFHAMQKIRSECKKNGTQLVVSNLQDQPYRVFSGAGLIHQLGKKNVCAHFEAALERAEFLIKNS